MGDLIKCHDEDPNRCQGIAPGNRQCWYLSEPDSSFCRLHGGSNLGTNLTTTERKKQELYELDRSEYLRGFHNRMQGLRDHPKAASVRDEIGILRTTLERIMQSIEDDTSLILRSGEIASLTSRIESLAKTAHTIERETKALMSQDEVNAIVGELLQLIFDETEKYKKDEEARINAVMGKIQSLTDDEESITFFRANLQPKSLDSLMELIADRYVEQCSTK